MKSREEVQLKHWSKDKDARRKPNHPAVESTFLPLASIVASLLQKPQSANVLDIGCGNGFLTVGTREKN